jgi:MFS family permease
MIKKYLPQLIILGALFFWYGLFVTQKIDLTTADLGRHIKNGEIILTNFSSDILKTNFYSYTNPAFPFVNHHWGSGVLFYLVWKGVGFLGLSLLFLLLSFATLALFFNIARRFSRTAVACIVSLLVIPLIAERTEIRPEVFSYFFTGIFFWLLVQYQNDQIKKYWLYILPGLQILWTNMHILFLLGPSLVGLFLLNELIRREKRERQKYKTLLVVLGGTLAAPFINPLGLKILIYPFTIFSNYGYRIVENQSIGFLSNLSFYNNPSLFLFKVTFALLVASFLLLAITRRQRLSFTLSILALVFSIMGWLALRNVAIFGLFAIPILSYNIYNSVLEKKRLPTDTIDAVVVILTIIIVVTGIGLRYRRMPTIQGNFGLGLTANNNAAAEFFLKTNLRGPIFNNYDIGGYLIYHLYPKEKVFVDNRPEAYPVSFFQNTYIPMQENEKVWEEKSNEYGFNTIFFSHRDMTPWAQKFLTERLKDPKWVPVFTDSRIIIFSKIK